MCFHLFVCLALCLAAVAADNGAAETRIQPLPEVRPTRIQPTRIRELPTRIQPLPKVLPLTGIQLPEAQPLNRIQPLPEVQPLTRIQPLPEVQPLTRIQLPEAQPLNKIQPLPEQLQATTTATVTPTSTTETSTLDPELAVLRLAVPLSECDKFLLELFHEAQEEQKTAQNTKSSEHRHAARDIREKQGKSRSRRSMRIYGSLWSHWEASSLGELPGCGEQGGQCDANCTGTWTSVFDACVGQSYSVFDSMQGLQPFDPIPFAATLSGLSAIGRNACASVPIASAINHPGVTVSCADTAVLVGVGGSLCGELLGQAACSQACQDILRAPLHSCEPAEQVPLDPYQSDQVVDARLLVNEFDSSLSEACYAWFQPLLDQWEGQATTTTTITITTTTQTSTLTTLTPELPEPQSECDAKLVGLFREAYQQGELPGCSEESGQCDAGCAGTWASVFDACIGQSVSLFGEGPEPFKPIAFAASFGARGLGAACASVPTAVALSYPGVTVDCADSIVLVNVAGQLCGDQINQTSCSQTCQDILRAPLHSCEPTEQVHSAWRQPDQLADVGSLILQLSSSLSGDCSAWFQPLLFQWLATTAATATQTTATSTTDSATTTTATSLTSTATASHTAIRANVVSTSAVMRVDNPEAFVADPTIRTSLTNSYAWLAGVAPSQCELVLSVVEQGQTSLRRLSGQVGQVEVSVVITLASSSDEPDAANDAADMLNNLDAASLASQVQSDLTAAGVATAVAVETVGTASVEQITLTATSATATATTTSATTAPTTSEEHVLGTPRPADTDLASVLSARKVVTFALASVFLFSL